MALLLTLAIQGGAPSSGPPVALRPGVRIGEVRSLGGFRARSYALGPITDSCSVTREILHLPTRSRIESVEVKLGKRVVKDVIRGDILEVEVDLEAEGLAWPDNEWLGLFRGYPDFPADLEEPRLEYGKLHFEAPDEDLQRAWSAIKERVAATNRSYGELLAPRRGVEERAEDERRADVTQRIEDAQKLLDSLD
jgi:hypothetical protein